jgi:hypothetical protein
MKSQNNTILYFAVGIIVLGLVYLLFVNYTTESFATEKKKEKFIAPIPGKIDANVDVSKDNVKISTDSNVMPFSFELKCDTDKDGNMTCKRKIEKPTVKTESFAVKAAAKKQDVKK